MSAVPRPSTRTPSSTMRLRTSFLVSDRMAALTSPAPLRELLAEGGLDLVAGRVEGGVALRLGGDEVRLGDGLGPDRLDAGPDVGLVVDEGREGDGLDRPRGRGPGLDELALQVDRLADPLLGRLEARRQHLLGDLGRAVLVVGPRLLGPAGLDHHDGDLGVGVLGQGPARDDELEGGGLALLEARVRDPLAVGRVGDAHGADGAVEGDARDHERGRRGVDGQDVVRVDLVGADDGAHDVDLVAEAVGEGRPQRPVDQATVRMAWSELLPSRRKNDPGILPAA